MNDLVKGMIPKEWNEEMIDYLKGNKIEEDNSKVRKYTITTPSEYEMKLFLSAKQFKIAIDEIREYVRNQLKYKELDPATYAIYEGIQKKMFEILDETSYFKLCDE
jgi:hypothetical protein